MSGLETGAAVDDLIIGGLGLARSVFDDDCTQMGFLARNTSTYVLC